MCRAVIVHVGYEEDERCAWRNSRQVFVILDTTVLWLLFTLLSCLTYYRVGLAAPAMFRGTRFERAAVVRRRLEPSDDLVDTQPNAAFCLQVLGRMWEGLVVRISGSGKLFISENHCCAAHVL